jgi:hypothetical protein
VSKLNLFPHVFSTTGAMDTANRCRYLFQLKYLEFWNLPERPWNTHLDFGIHFAKAKETVVLAFYKHAKSEHDSIQEGVDYLEDIFAPLYRAAGMDEPVKNPTKAVEMLRRYFEECKLEEGDLPFQLLDYDMSIEKSLLLEIPFKHPETGLPLYISAKYDMLIIEQPADILVITDDKTSGYSAGDTYDKVETTMLKYKLGGQFVQYAVVTNGNPDLIYGRKVNHGEVRIVLTSQKAAGAVGKPIPKKQPFVERLHFAITDFHQEEWYISILDLISELLERYERLKKGDTHAFRKSFGHCISKDVEKYSFRPCDFWQHCTDASWKDLEHRYGMQQMVYDKETDTTKSLANKRKELGL